MAQAKAAPSETVYVAVWVMKPGPMAAVAIRKMAPRTAERLERVVCCWSDWSDAEIAIAVDAKTEAVWTAIGSKIGHRRSPHRLPIGNLCAATPPIPRS